MSYEPLAPKSPSQRLSDGAFTLTISQRVTRVSPLVPEPLRGRPLTLKMLLSLTLRCWHRQ
jgi:hypothetical protein